MITKILRELMHGAKSGAELREAINCKRWFFRIGAAKFQSWIHDNMELKQMVSGRHAKKTDGEIHYEVIVYSITGIGREEFYDRTT